jgi:hypothetical protein
MAGAAGALRWRARCWWRPQLAGRQRKKEMRGLLIGF